MKTLLLQLVQMLVLLVKRNLQQVLKVLLLLILTVKKQVQLLVVRVQRLALLLEQAVQRMKKPQPKEKKKLVQVVKMQENIMYERKVRHFVMNHKPVLVKAIGNS